MEQDITYEQLKDAAARADRAGDNYAGRILLSMSDKLMKWGKLTLRQTDFARSLIERHSPRENGLTVLKAMKNFKRKLK